MLWSFRLVTLALALGLGVVAVEVGLQLLVRLGALDSFSSRTPNHFHHDVLQYRMPPGIYPDIDQRGYRNEVVSERAEIVALGDSQTYGYNAASDQTWPKQLQRLTRTHVYNMGIGGYGPAQYYYLTSEALQMEPRHIVVGIFLGNDVINACDVFDLPYWRRFAEERGLDVADCRRFRGDVPKGGAAVPAGQDQTVLSIIRPWVRYSEALMLLKQVPLTGTLYSRWRDRRKAVSHPEAYYAVEEPGAETVVDLGYSTAMDPERPIVQAGTRLTKFFCSAMLEQVENVRIVVVFIPTKANVMYEYLLRRGHELPSGYHDLVSKERSLQSELAGWLERRGAVIVDPLPELQNALSSGSILFVDYADVHFTPPGYQTIARAIYAHYFALAL